MFFTAFVLCILTFFKLKTEDQTVYSKLHCKVTKFKWKFSLNLDPNGALNNPAQELRFKVWLNLYITKSDDALRVTILQQKPFEILDSGLQQ